MKFVLPVFLFLMFTARIAVGQDTLYYDFRNQLVKKRNKAEFIQVIAKTDTGYVVQMLSKSLELKSKTTYSDATLKTREGYHIAYAGSAVDSEGRYLNGKEEGPWNIYYGGKQTAALVYSDGRLVGEKHYKPNGEIETDRKKIEQLPSFAGGQMELGNYLKRTLKYPKNSRDNRISGTVLLEFTVAPNGQVSDVDIINPVSSDIDEEAKRVVRQMPRWNPGIQYGRPVRVRYRMPLAFRLN